MSIASENDSAGLLRPWEQNRAFELRQSAPDATLAPLVERRWIVRWDLRGDMLFRQETLPHPSINIVVEPHGARVWGVPTARDVRLLRDVGWAVGAKLQPGAFTACTGIAASDLTDESLFLHQALGAGDAFESAADPSGISAALELLTATEALMLERLPARGPAVELVQAALDEMQIAPPDARVADLAAVHGLTARAFQRLFRHYVGVGPKWVLKRLRIHRAVERLNASPQPDWTDLALDLGYYDHSHFIRDFRLVAGRSPADYAAEVRAGAEKG